MRPPVLNPVFLLSGFLFIAIVLKRGWLAPVLNGAGLSELDSELISTIVHNVLVIIFSYWAIKKMQLERRSGLLFTRIKDAHLVLYPMAIILFMGIGNLTEIAAVETKTVLLFFLSMMAIGFAEEFAFRGFIQAYLVDLLRSRWAVFITAGLFGLIHFMNLIKEPDNVVMISKQVLFAAGIGVYFGALLLRTGSLWLLSVLHGLIDFIFGAYEITDTESNPLTTPIKEPSPSLDLIYVFALLLLFTGWYLMKDIKFEEREAV